MVEITLKGEFAYELEPYLWNRKVFMWFIDEYRLVLRDDHKDEGWPYALKIELANPLVVLWKVWTKKISPP